MKLKLSPVDQLIAARVASQYVQAGSSEYVERIKSIPNYDRSNFLQSILAQVLRGRTLSEKQLAVLEKIERESPRSQSKPQPRVEERVPSKAVQVGKWWDTDSVGGVITQALWDDGEVVQAVDPYNVLNERTIKWIHGRLMGYPSNGRDILEEALSDEDDPKRREEIFKSLDTIEKLSDDLARTKLDVKRSGKLVTLRIHPSISSIYRKYGWNRNHS